MGKHYNNDNKNFINVRHKSEDVNCEEQSGIKQNKKIIDIFRAFLIREVDLEMISSW